MRTLYPKYKKHFGGERDDLAQSAIVAVLEWAKQFEDSDQLPENYVAVVDDAIVSEVRNNPRGRDQWVTGSDCSGVIKRSPSNYTLDQEMLLETLRKAVSMHIADQRRVDVLWMSVVLRMSDEEIADRLNEGRLHRAEVLPNQVHDWVATDTNVLRGKLRPDLVEAMFNFNTFTVSKDIATNRRYNQKLMSDEL